MLLFWMLLCYLKLYWHKFTDVKHQKDVYTVCKSCLKQPSLYADATLYFSHQTYLW